MRLWNCGAANDAPKAGFLFFWSDSGIACGTASFPIPDSPFPLTPTGAPR